MSTGSPTFSTVGGGIGVNYTYNSQAEPTGGLTGSYYGTAFGSTDHRTNTPDNPSLVRRDPVMNFNWGTGGPNAAIGSGQMYAKWTGYISIPTTGGYKIGGSCAGGLKFVLGTGASTATADAWTGCTAGVDTWSATVTYNAGDVVPITAEYWRQSGTASVNLKVRGPGLPAPAGIDMPATWMSTSAPGLPAGWAVSADLDGAATYRSAVITAEAVTFLELDGTPHRYSFDSTKNAFQAPVDEHGTVGRNTDGSVTLIDEDGQTYTFDVNGKLTTVTSALDDTNTAAATMAWAGTPERLTSITDPVSGRKITLAYAGDPACNSGTGFSPAPAGMLCALDYGDFAGGNTYLRYNASGQLARLEDPGAEITDFAYDASGRINKVRDPLAADAVAAGVRADDDTTRNVITYDASNRIASVTQPAPQAGETRPAHSYTYSTGGADVSAAGLTSTTGKLQHVVYDPLGRPTAVTDQSGGVTTTYWDPQNRVIATSDSQTGLTSTTVYDVQGNTTDTWGPAPTAWWSSPAGGGPPVITNNAAQTAANQANTPHESTVFDGGINGLAGTWWSNATFTGAPAKRTTWTSGNAPGVTGAFSGRLTGWINIANTNPVDFRLSSAGTARLTIGNRLVIDGATAANGAPARSFDGTYTPGANDSGLQPVTVEYANAATIASLTVLSRQGAAAYAAVAPATLSPGYGLATRSADANGNITDTSYTDAAAGLGPEHGLATATTTDPGGLALVNRTTYEGAGGYRREVSHQLPTGAASTVKTDYYGPAETRDVPCGGDTGVNQGGATKRVTAADPSGNPAGTNGLTRESVYDKQGRLAATQVAADGVTNWSCTSYDARSRPTKVTAPDLPQRPGRITDTDYKVGGNPLVTSVTDTVSGQARTVTTTVDLLGRPRQYVDAWGDTTVTSYDQVGRVAQTQSAVGTETMTYDAAGNAGSTVLDGATLATPHYDSANRLDWVQYANGTKTDPVARDLLGREVGSTWKNASTNAVLSTETSTLDPGGRLTDLVTDGNDPRANAPNYVYDTAGRLTDAWTTTRDSAGLIGSRHSAYGFGTASGTCAAGTQAEAGKNTNRTSQTIGDGGTAVTTSYCYDASDKLVSTTEPGVGAPSYDSHGNTTTLYGEDRGYDSTDRHSSTIHAGTTVAYTRDGTDRIIARQVGNPATETERYGFTRDGDTPDLTLDGSNTVVERNISLPGGASVTWRGTDQVWSLSNLHGDTAIVTDATGAVQGPQRTYDPFGNTTGQPLVDNSAGAYDYGWLGEHQRGTEHENGLTQTIEMGARQYDPTLGRFLETDPVEGGSANDYDYVHGDPVNAQDLDGNCESKTVACVIGILTKGFYLPKGFAAFLARRSRGAVVKHHRYYGKSRAYKSDGSCSVGFGSGGFQNACKTHDLGYDLMRFFGSSGRKGSIRKAVDNLLYNDFKTHCKHVSYRAKISCGIRAKSGYSLVSANSKRQGYGVP